MKFPLISDIATRKVVHIDISSQISEALNVLVGNIHRNVLVTDGDTYRILTVIDVLNLQQNKIPLDSKLSSLDLQEVPVIYRDKNVLDTLEYLQNSIEYICVLDRDGSLFGLLTHTDITSNIDPDTLMDNYKLSEFLKLGRKMKWVEKHTITSVLLVDMISGGFDNVVIVEDMKPIGILTTKDILKLIQNKSDVSLSVTNYMSQPVQTINKNSSIKEALEYLKSKHFKRIIVVDDKDNLSGIVSQKELISLTYSRWATLMQEYQDELSQINNMLENKNREYETMASTDSLTGLYNRYKFSELYLSSYKVMLQRNQEMSLLILDIDFFKKVNDTYGHNIGDQVLIQISHAIIKALRNIDIICRWGGEEFIMLLPTASLKNAQELANKLRISIEELELDIVGRITVSIGVASVKEGDTMQDVVERADSALYLAKDSGRNCVKSELDK